MIDPVSSPDLSLSPTALGRVQWAESLRQESEAFTPGAVREFFRGVAQMAREVWPYEVPVPPGARGMRRFAWICGPIDFVLEGLARELILDVEPVTDDGWEAALARVVLRAGTGAEVMLTDGATSQRAGWCVQWRFDLVQEWIEPKVGMGVEWGDLGRCLDDRVLRVRAGSAGNVTERLLMPVVDDEAFRPSQATTEASGGGIMEAALKMAVENWVREGARLDAELEAGSVHELSSSHETVRPWCAWALNGGARPDSEQMDRLMLGLACAGVRAVAWVGRGSSPGEVPSVGPATNDFASDRGAEDGIELRGVREVLVETVPSQVCREGEALVLLGRPGRWLDGRLEAGEGESRRLLVSTVRGLVLAGVLRSASVGAREGLARTLVNAGAGRGWVLEISDPELTRAVENSDFWSDGRSAYVLASSAVEDAGGVVARARLLGVPAWRLGVVRGTELRWVTETGEFVIPRPVAVEIGAPPSTASGA